MEEVFDLDSISLDEIEETEQQTKPVERYQSVSDAIILTRDESGEINIKKIAEAMDLDPMSVIELAKPGISIFHHPLKAKNSDDQYDYFKGWMLLNDFLAEDLEQLQDECEKASLKNQGQYFEDSVRVIKKYKQPVKTAENVKIHPANPMVPTSLLKEFCYDYLVVRYFKLTISKDSLTHTYKIDGKKQYALNPKSYTGWGTINMCFLDIFEHILNRTPIVIYEENSYFSNDSRREDHQGTVAVNQIAQEIIEYFAQWIWIDPVRKEKMLSILNRVPGHYHCYDGSFMEFKDINPEITLRKIQQDSICAGMLTKKRAFVLSVGAGKTFILGAIGYERKRLGFTKKNVFVVPNTILGQWEDSLKQLYPHCRILTILPKKDFIPGKKQQTLAKIRDEGEKYDFILMPFSVADQIPVSKKTIEDEMVKKIQELEDSVKKHQSMTKLQTRLKKEKEKLFKFRMQTKDSNVIYWDDLKIDGLYVDEIHNYFNQTIESNMRRVYGISLKGSAKCDNFQRKVQSVSQSGGYFYSATATPARNSIVNLYNYIRMTSIYLNLYSIYNFDSWISYFADTEEAQELDLTLNYHSATRIRKFFNIDDLTAILSSFITFYEYKPDNLPKCDGYTDIVIPLNPHVQKYQKEVIAQRIENIKKSAVDPKEDNMLKVTTDLRKASVDPRLVEPSIEEVGHTKIDAAADCIADIYKKYEEKKLTQAVFCDLGTPKKGFNVYDELKQQLVRRGVKAEEIAFVQSCTTQKKKSELFAKVNSGQIRVIMTSRSMCQGINVQQKMIAVHHLDCPIRPSDQKQADGRMIREYNENKVCYKYRYIMNGTGDAYMYQLCENKSNVENELLGGFMKKNSVDDITDIVLDYANAKSIALANGYVKELTEVKNKLAKTIAMQKNYYSSLFQMEAQIEEQTRNNERLALQIQIYKKDMALEADNYVNNQQLTNQQETERRRYLRDTIYKALSNNINQPNETKLMSYRGFWVVLPKEMKLETPYIYLVSEGKHFVKMDKEFNEKGCLIRIDNYINGLPEKIQQLKKALEDNQKLVVRLKEEIQKNQGDPYSSQIVELSNQIKEIEKKMKEKAHETTV